MGERIHSYKELHVYQNVMDAAMDIFKLTKRFPLDERFSMDDQIRRSSRSVCVNLGEAWRKRRYKAAFIAKLSDAEGEACETQIWLEFAQKCNYLNNDDMDKLYNLYNHIISQIVVMIKETDKWLIK